MSEKAQAAVALFEKHVGAPEKLGDWFEVTQEQVNLFADATHDHQFIHVDPEKAAKLSPYKVTIAHGFLTLSMVVHLGKSIPPDDPKAYDGVVMGVNYGLDKVRFPAPVPVGSRIRARRQLVGAETKGNAVQLKQLVTVEIEGQEKPGCVAETLTRLVYA